MPITIVLHPVARIGSPWSVDRFNPGAGEKLRAALPKRRSGPGGPLRAGLLKNGAGPGHSTGARGTLSA